MTGHPGAVRGPGTKKRRGDVDPSAPVRPVNRCDKQLVQGREAAATHGCSGVVMVV